MSNENCTICEGSFDLDLEGGRRGSIGILPVAFCPTCLAGIMDFAETELRFYDEDYLLELFGELIDGRQNEEANEGGEVALDGWEQLDGSEGGARHATMGLLGPSLAQGRHVFESFFGREEVLVKIADHLVQAYDDSPWLDYSVPAQLRRKLRIWWQERRP